MATDLKASPKHELFVEHQLERVRKRIHVLDLGRLGLLLGAIVLAHALVMSLIDLSGGPHAAKWVAVLRYGIWGVSLAGFLFLGCALLLRLSARINPYFAARQIEETIPDAKNSVVNWLDLKKEPLPPVVKMALDCEPPATSRPPTRNNRSMSRKTPGSWRSSSACCLRDCWGCSSRSPAVSVRSCRGPLCP